MKNLFQLFVGTSLTVLIVTATSLSAAGALVAEDGSGRTPAFRDTEVGAEHTPGFRVAEDGSDHTAIGRLG